MSPTLLELVMVIVLIVIAWQISRAVAPDVLRWLRSQWQGQDSTATNTQVQPDLSQDQRYKEEHTNGTRH